MKTILTRLFTLMLLVLASVPALAYDFIVDGIAYNVLEDGSCEVTHDYNYKYSGEVVIPVTVKYEGKTYAVTKIGNSAFSSCSGLTSVTIPASVTSIGEYAFYSCESLTSIAIPNSVTSIGNYAFSDCTSLMSVNIPKSLTEISYDAFCRCSSLIAINVDGNNPKLTSIDGVLYNKDVTEIVVCPEAKSGAFSIPGSVTSIGESAFIYCKSLTSIDIPNSVTSVCGYAFYYCRGLTSINIPASVTSIGNYAFAGCEKLTSISVDKSNAAFTMVDGVLYDKDLTKLIVCNKSVVS